MRCHGGAHVSQAEGGRRLGGGLGVYNVGLFQGQRTIQGSVQVLHSQHSLPLDPGRHGEIDVGEVGDWRIGNSKAFFASGKRHDVK